MTSRLCENDFACRANKFTIGNENGPGSLAEPGPWLSYVVGSDIPRSITDIRAIRSAVLIGRAAPRRGLRSRAFFTGS